MRVALVAATTAHHAPSDGAQRMQRLARLLTGDHEVVVFTTKWWDGAPTEFEHDGVIYRQVAPSPSASTFAATLGPRIRAFRPDVIHVTCDPPSHVIGARIAATLSRSPYVVECYDPPKTRGWLASRLFRSGLKRADAVITPSRTVKTRVRESGIPGERIRVIPSGIDFDAIRHATPADGGDIVFSRHLDEAANLETLLLALAEFRTYDWDATIIGDGPKRVAYERQVRDLRIDDRVEFVGDKDESARIALFKGAHVYAHTAEYTPFAIDLLRALASGCVGIVEYHAASSAHELVEHEDRGFTATSAQELTRQLTRAGDLDRLDANERFAAYDDEYFLERYLDVYRNAASR